MKVKMLVWLLPITMLLTGCEISESKNSTDEQLPTVEIVKEMLDVPKHKSSWDIVLSHQNRFVFSDESPDFAWNYPGKFNGYPVVSERWSNKSYYLSTQDNEIRVALEGNREDSIRSIVALGELMKDQWSLRYCIDSWHSSGQAYIALKHNEWTELERLYGKEAIAYRFVIVSGTYEEFSETAFTEEHARTYD